MTLDVYKKCKKKKKLPKMFLRDFFKAMKQQFIFL